MGDGLTEPLSPHQAGEPVPPRPHTELRRVTIHEHDPRNDCMTARGVGFSWRCTCGERGPIYRLRFDAHVGKRKHEASHA